MSQTFESAVLGGDDFTTTTIRIPRAVHQLLRQVTMERVATEGC